ncbi:MAG: hypothetical protein IPM01_27380 [Burkholderiaceae bacterium]|nr:hypothetical protein [Burkholderiaceae bacterium]
MSTLTNELLDEARRQVRGQGARVTYPRVRVFAELLQAHEALSHLDLQRRIEHESHAEPIDRVTLYRVLEWLVEAGWPIVFRVPIVSTGSRPSRPATRCTGISGARSASGCSAWRKRPDWPAWSRPCFRRGFRATASS